MYTPTFVLSDSTLLYGTCTCNRKYIYIIIVMNLRLRFSNHFVQVFNLHFYQKTFPSLHVKILINNTNKKFVIITKITIKDYIVLN